MRTHTASFVASGMASARSGSATTTLVTRDELPIGHTCESSYDASIDSSPWGHCMRSGRYGIRSTALRGRGDCPVDATRGKDRLRSGKSALGNLSNPRRESRMPERIQRRAQRAVQEAFPGGWNDAQPGGNGTEE